MKPRVVFLLQVTALCGIFTYDFKEGYGSGRNYIDSIQTSIVVLVGGTFASGGSMAVNMWYERDIDPLMERTENRPIQSGFISPNHALIFGICISLLGVILVSTLANSSAGIITALSALFYTVVYTMILKRRTPQNIVIGGLAGSTPPAIGWAAASGEAFNLLPWLMVLTIFLWTPAHFWALTLSKRRDYGEAGGQYTHPKQVQFTIERDKEYIKPNYHFDLCRLSMTILEELNSKEYSEESLKFLNHMCKNSCDISFCDMPDDFYLYKSIAKDACNCLPREVIMNDIFKSYRIKKKLFPRKSYYTL